MAQGQQFWQQIAPIYSQSRTFSARYALYPALEVLIGNIKGQQALDIACGTGEITRLLAHKGALVTGIDYSQPMLDQAKRLSQGIQPPIDFQLLNIAHLTNINHQFDLITIVNLLPHLSRLTEITDLFHQVSKLISINGRLIVAEPHPAFDYYMRQSNADYHQSGKQYQFSMVLHDQKFESLAYHWRLEDYIAAANKSGWLIRQLLETKLKPAAKKEDLQQFKQKQSRPSYVLLELVRH